MCVEVLRVCLPAPEPTEITENYKVSVLRRALLHWTGVQRGDSAKQTGSVVFLSLSNCSDVDMLHTYSVHACVCVNLCHQKSKAIHIQCSQFELLHSNKVERLINACQQLMANLVKADFVLHMWWTASLTLVQSISNPKVICCEAFVLILLNSPLI